MRCVRSPRAVRAGHPPIGGAARVGLLFAALVAGCGEDGSGSIEDRPAWDPSWSRCDVVDQCVRVEAECCRCEGRAVVERHRQRARAALGTAGCACEESERCVDWSAACVDQRCVVRDPEATALAEAVQEGGATPSEQACETSDQCRVIGRECLGTIAVNRAHYDVVRQRVIDRLSAGIACGGSTGATEPPPEASCVSGRCVVR